MFEQNTIELAIEAEEWHQILARRCVHKPDGSCEITREHDAVAYVETLLKTTKKIAASTRGTSKRVKGIGRLVPKFTRLGEDLHLACRQYRECMFVWRDREMVPRYQGHKFCPHLDLSLTAISEVAALVEQASSSGDYELLHQTIGGLAATIRRRCSTQEFKTEVRNYERNAKAKFERALRYLLSLFRKRSRLLILRVDLYVREKDRNWSYSPEADAAYDRFLEALTERRIVPDVIGWMGAREDGLDRGQHYHLLVAVDGHLHQAGAHLAKLLGEYWKDHCVPAGRSGSYFNCFALEKKYKYLGIGMVHNADAKKLLGLYYATRYLCKEEVQLVAVGERKRNFRRGVMTKEPSRRGAPRLNGDELVLAKRVFFTDWEVARKQIKAA
jgi:hypothetical protein